MGQVNPGLGERLEGLVNDIRAKEAEAQDNPANTAALKAVLSYCILALIELNWRDDGSHAFDWEAEDRTAGEERDKGQAVVALGQLLGLLHGAPVRTWSEVGELEEAWGLLQAGEDGGWEPEVIRLGGEAGVTVQRQYTSGGSASFATAAGTIEVMVYKARTPEVMLPNVAVYLIQKLATGQLGFVGGEFELEPQYAVMVDDPYWGRRIQGVGYAAAPLSETCVMGYWVRGRVLHDGVPQEGANVSLEGVVEGPGGAAIFWDSLEYNELIWSDTLETWVEGALVTAPIMTGEDGRWAFICPKGHGAIYQREGDRRDDSEETASQAPPRKLTRLAMAYLGRKAELSEGTEAVIDILSGKLVVSGEPGAWVKVGTLDESGGNYLIGAEGSVTVEGLPTGEHGVVQFKLNGWGEWESEWGCARQIVGVQEGGTATVGMGVMDFYDQGGNLIAGRVYERMGVPAAGIAIVPIDYESGVVGEAIATTDGGGYWEAEIPAEGFGGDPWVHDPQWGSVPVLGFPYSDVVLGARAYAGFAEMYKPEAWRKGDRGHANFQYVQDEIVVEDIETEAQFGTTEAAYGGWVTVETLPKYRHVEDINELIVGGPQLRYYRLRTPREVLLNEFCLEAQSFEEYETLPGQYRAAGFYPEAKFLIGGKVHGGVVTGCGEAIGLELPEAARIGLEFGAHEWFTQVTAIGGAARRACFADLVCPYCGGPLWRDPSAAGFVRGCCWQCAMAFGMGNAMDGRTHFTTPALPPGPLPTGEGGQGSGHRLESVVVPRGGGSRRYDIRYHWRPDLYEENDNYLTQSGAGQATNALRWFAQHVDEVAEGLGFGRFDSEGTPAFTAGHDLAWFGALPEVDRNLGVTQMKLVFPTEYSQAAEVTVELDCRLENGSQETVRVVIPAGTRGPNADRPLSDVVALKAVGKWAAERKASPYRGCGLYVAVTGARVVEPAGAACRFTVVNDVGLLASPLGTPVEERRATPAALQLGWSGGASGPHLMDDAVEQMFIFYAREGNIWMQRREGLANPWQEARQITSEGENTEPCAEKDEGGRLRLFWQREGDTVGWVSVDDGEEWLSG
jgi:hypothetical protein